MEELKELGLTGYEIKVYETLLKIGRSDAKKISQYSKVPPTAVYPSLNSLYEKEFIQKFEGDLAFYEAIEPKIALQKYTDNQIAKFKKLKKDSIEKLNNLKIENVPIKEFEPVKLSAGLEISKMISLDMIKHAKKYLYIAGWTFRKTGGMYDVLKELKKTRERNVDVKIILTKKTKENTPFIEGCEKIGVRCKIMPLNYISIMVSDDLNCKITLKKEELKERINLKIEDENLVIALKDYFLTLWKK
jgi:sugar-specific transcriptional regulator TrmB